MGKNKIQIRFSTILVSLIICSGLIPLGCSGESDATYSGLCPLSDSSNITGLCPFSGSGYTGSLCPLSGSGYTGGLCPFSDGDTGASCISYEYEYLINSVPQNPSSNSCSGSISTSFSYSNAALIIPEKNSVMSANEKNSFSTAINLKEQVLGKYLQ